MEETLGNLSAFYAMSLAITSSTCSRCGCPRSITPALKTKIFLAILAALTVIGGAVLYQRDQMHKAASSGKNSRDSPMQRDDAEYQKQKTKSFGRRSKRTRSGTVLQRHMKARPRKRTSPKPTEKKPPSWLPLRC